MTKKEIITHFLHLSAKGQSREAFELYVAPDFIHHNAYFKGDRNTLMLAMEENAIQNPNKIFEIQRILEDEHLVAVHSRIQLQQNNLEAETRIDNLFARVQASGGNGFDHSSRPLSFGSFNQVHDS